ncbi:MAG: hypothetical protein NVSMB14_16780 [Isosphaeraceae bacterium]
MMEPTKSDEPIPTTVGSNSAPPILPPNPIASSTAGPLSTADVVVDKTDSPKPIEIVFGLSLMIAWLILLGVGTVYSSKVYDDRLTDYRFGTTLRVGSTLCYFFLFVMTYTVTNTLLLCVFASALGQSGRRDRIDGDETQIVKSRPGQYFGAMLRGFMTYLFVVSGSVVIANKTYDNPNRQDYLTFAATVSVLGFLAGYNPSLFVRFMNGIRFTLPAPGGASNERPKAGASGESSGSNPSSRTT